MKNKEIESEFVIYPLALRMKNIGFNEPCMKGFTEEYKELINFINTHTNTSVRNTLPTKTFTAPTWQSAFAWLIPKIDDEYKVSFRKEGWFIYNLEDGEFQGSEALEKLIEIVERKSKKKKK